MNPLPPTRLDAAVTHTFRFRVARILAQRDMYKAERDQLAEAVRDYLAARVRDASPAAADLRTAYERIAGPRHHDARL
jgi:hypothetical protein